MTSNTTYSSDSNSSDFDEEQSEKSDQEYNGFDSGMKTQFQKSSVDTKYKMKQQHDNVQAKDEQDVESGSEDQSQHFGQMSKATKRKCQDLSQDSQESTNKMQRIHVENKGQRMMRKMGYEAGEGLGKNKQGRLEPVEASKQHGRRGFGLHIPGLETARLKWNPDEEEINVQENMEWLLNTHNDIPSIEDLKKWTLLGPKKLTIDDETHFCNPETVSQIINSKSVFDKLDKVELDQAKARCNPYETIRGALFLNRAAVKMANIDKVCNFMFTSPEGLRSDELLYFADVCAGPGGFSEYVLWRKKWYAKGFGFTLKNENDFKLEDFYAGACETFHPFYGPKGDGDVYDPKNQEEFRDIILKHTNGKGVHFMMSDGGFSVKGQENIQEILSKQLYLCQCLVALMIVRTGGSFVTKLFDLFTPFSAGLIYLMYRCFESICIFKPNSSRPANSERYLICKKKRNDTQGVMEYLAHINQLILENDENNDVINLVSLDELEKEKQFIQYLRASNNYLGKKQIIGLLKIAAFAEDHNLIEPKQADMHKQCLKYWKIPEDPRVAPHYPSPTEKLNQILKMPFDFLSCSPEKLTEENMKNTILNAPLNWLYMPCASSQHTDENRIATFYLGMGHRKVYRYVKDRWKYVSDMSIELPPNTLVYAEVVDEATKEKKNQYRTPTLHILDSYVLGGNNVTEKYITDRHELTKKFCEALWKPCPGECMRIRAKELFHLQPDINEKLHIKRRIMKNNTTALTYEFEKSPLDDNNNDGNPSYFVLNSILFLTSTAYPWTRHYSKSNSSTYVFNCKTKASDIDKYRPKEAGASSIEAFKRRVVWYWPNDASPSMDTMVTSIRKIYDAEYKR